MFSRKLLLKENSWILVFLQCTSVLLDQPSAKFYSWEILWVFYGIIIYNKDSEISIRLFEYLFLNSWDFG